MEDASWVNFVSPKSNRGTISPAAVSDSTLSNSPDSGVTVESFRCCSCETCADSDTRLLDECSGWTNEKHNAYLDDLERSFVRQMFCLMGRKQKSCTSHDVTAKSNVPTDHKVNSGTKRTNDQREERNYAGGNASIHRALGNRVGHECWSESIGEAWGQNFGDEEDEEHKASLSRAVSKRWKNIQNS